MCWREDVPEAAPVEFEIMFFGVLFDGIQSRASSFFVIGFLLGVSLVRHLTLL